MANTAPLLEKMVQDPILVAETGISVFESCVNHLMAHEKIEQMLAENGNAHMGDDFWPEPDSWMASLRPYNVVDGILQIPVMGALLNRFPYQYGGWATGYTYIERAFLRGLEDDNVKGIAFVVDSFGGIVSGNFELVDLIFSRRGEKPIRAFASDYAFSAAYSIASAADSISITRSGSVGSIGVMTAHVSHEEALDKRGIKVTLLYAGKHKVDGNRNKDLSKQARKNIQARIDKLYGVFTTTVARNRNMSDKSVRDTEALTYDAEDAISVGLADQMGSLDDEMALFADEVANMEGYNMSNTTLKKPGAEGYDQAAYDAGVETATAEGKASGVTEGATAERQRVSDIMSCDNAEGRKDAALSMATTTDMSVEQVNTVLGTLPKTEAKGPSDDGVSGDGETEGKLDANGKPIEAKGNRNHFEESMQSNNPEAGAGTGSEDESNGKPTASSVLGDYAMATGADFSDNK